MLSLRATSAVSAARAGHCTAMARPRSMCVRRVVGLQELALLAAPGDVEAPTSALIGAAVLVTLAATVLVPLALKPGDDAAQKIFASKQKNPIDKKGSAKGKTTKGGKK